jgi:hypothetical protein
VLSQNILRGKRDQEMKEERRLVWRVLRHWRQIAEGGRLPRREEIDVWMRGKDVHRLAVRRQAGPKIFKGFDTLDMKEAKRRCLTSWRDPGGPPAGSNDRR